MCFDVLLLVLAILCPLVMFLHWFLAFCVLKFGFFSMGFFYFCLRFGFLALFVALDLGFFLCYSGFLLLASSIWFSVSIKCTWFEIVFGF